MPRRHESAMRYDRQLFRPRHTDKIFRSGLHKDWSNGVQCSPKGTETAESLSDCPMKEQSRCPDEPVRGKGASARLQVL